MSDGPGSPLRRWPAGRPTADGARASWPKACDVPHTDGRTEQTTRDSKANRPDRAGQKKRQIMSSQQATTERRTNMALAALPVWSLYNKRRRRRRNETKLSRHCELVKKDDGVATKLGMKKS